MITFTQKEKGIKNKILHDDKQRETNPSVFFAIM
jgi:hypothetical protein